MKQFLTLLALFVLTGCANNNQDEIAVADSTAHENPHFPITFLECFAQKTPTDTVLLNIRTENEIITGDLYINRRGKDLNNGTITGRMNGDTLYADYYFMAEGMWSVREVAFLRIPIGIFEGTGPLDQQGDRIFFSDRNKISFNTDMFLYRSECKD